MSPSPFDQLSLNETLYIISFLSFRDAIGFSSTSNKHWTELYSNEHMLATCLANQNKVAGRAVLAEAMLEDPPSGVSRRLHALRLACRRISCMGSCSLSTMEVKYLGRKVDRMEGHAMVSLLSRYLVIIGGWGAGFSNQIYMLDALSAAGGLGVEGVDVQTTFVENWTFSYGFSCVPLCPAHELDNDAFDIQGHGFAPSPERCSADTPAAAAAARRSALRTRLLFFGGCSEGGYSGSTSGFFYIDLSVSLPHNTHR